MFNKKIVILILCVYFASATANRKFTSEQVKCHGNFKFHSDFYISKCI